MSILLKIIPVVLAAFCLASCNSSNEDVKNNDKENTVKKPRQGDVRDGHGCLTSMGYIWSEAKDTCIRLYESGAELVPTDRSELVIYAVLSDDKMKAEIFVPDDTTYMLTGNGGDTYTGDSIRLSVNGDKYLLTSNGKPIYQTALPEAAQQQRKPKRAAPKKAAKQISKKKKR
jgi:hypothetical protein